MNSVSAIKPMINSLDSQVKAPGDANNPNNPDNPKFIESFNTFVGQTFYGSMLKSMRETVGKAPYFNGGMAEKMFTQQLDQMLAEKLGKTSASKLSAPMLKLYQLQRS